MTSFAQEWFGFVQIRSFSTLSQSGITMRIGSQGGVRSIGMPHASCEKLMIGWISPGAK